MGFPESYRAGTIPDRYPAFDLGAVPQFAWETPEALGDWLGRVGLSPAKAATLLGITEQEFATFLRENPGAERRYQREQVGTIARILENLQRLAMTNRPELAESYFRLKEQFQ